MLFQYLLATLPLALAGPVIKPRAPVITPREGRIIPDKYIVKFKNDALGDVLNKAIEFLNKEPEHIYGFAGYKGFAAEFKEDILDLITALPGVDYVEKDAIMTANLGLQSRAEETQSDAPWGLARLSSAEPGTTTYNYDSSAGEGSCAYIIDTGIFVDHPEFEGRAEWLQNFAGDGDDTDGNGHGTHCAGTIGSKTYGVAKKTKLFAVKVLDAEGSGSNSGVIAGIQFAAKDQKNRTECSKGSVANLSLGGPQSQMVNDAAANAVKDGLFMAVAAGNEGEDASNSSPASEKTVYTVGATDINDQIADFSNFGKFVDILAPGVDILSTWNDGKTNTISGTSMATPHVAGLAAYILALEGKKSVADLSSRLSELATKDVLKGLPNGTVNALAFNGITASSS
ncbi:subtilisin-like serine protease-like protein PR1A [Aaosphaeria arxii CBS 175.79]|uniref:Subtilisin-like serine protease-like protein PR1A n=1 Tax=Aaosphaeria arxii CBS 175.79 TaxID=1450172 RepID=A0A6A5X6S4_9PLEO|nr:subtilisin-like serine protease-like protein PR1A [Aaosphaeria arxii CBS 175.79]KAF2008663.1 subtilisin-like serine protease-like protein PR1A [Aaosphaeria arxii CBS 175.79]